jgi:glycosyltransferase involved in cell wall biosynthesis
MKVLHAYNRHRGGGGANNATQATIDLSREAGVQVQVLARSANELQPGLRGRLQVGLGLLWGRASLLEFRSLLDSFQPDLVHAHELYPLVSPWILPECSRRGIPVVMSCVDFRLTCPQVTHSRQGQLCTLCLGGREHHALLNNCRGSLPESAAAALYNLGVRSLGLYRRHVQHFIAPSHFAQRWLVDHGALPADRVSTIAPAVAMPDTAAAPATGTYIAYAGRFAPEKGLDVFAAASQRSAAPFRMARHADSLVTIDVPPGPELLLTRTPQELAAFYRGARAVVLPSRWFETFGLVGAEAMAHGVPVIGSRLGAVADLIDDGVDGLLFEAGDALALAAQVQRLWDAPALAARLGQAARDKALRLWSPQQHLKQVLAVYEAVLASR